MTFLFDHFGWATEDQQFADRVASVPAPTHTAPVEGQAFPNWTGYEWVMLTYTAPPPAPEPIPEPEPTIPDWYWFIDIGPFYDRFGAAKMAVLTSTDAGVKAILADLSIRKWIDLKRPDVAQALAYVGTIVPAVDANMQLEILNTPPTSLENLALRKLYFNA